MSIILNVMALVVVSKMQELVPVSGRVSSDNSSKPENSNSWLALNLEKKQKEGDGAQKGKSQRHPHKGLVVLPRELKCFTRNQVGL